MGNWNICEDNYPGPAVPVTLGEIFNEFHQKIIISNSLFRKLVRDLSTRLAIPTEEASDKLKEMDFLVARPSFNAPLTLKQSYDPYCNNSLLFDPSWGEKERKEHALKCRQNRNTGPIIEWGFERDGRRTT